MRVFGFEINRKRDGNELPSFVPPQSDQDDGAMVVQSGGVYGTYVDLDGTVRSEAELVNKYRSMAEHPEVEAAIDHVVNDSIVMDDIEELIQIDLDKATIGGVKISEPIKTKIRAEFEFAKELLEFNKLAYEIYKRWYVDGRIYYHVVIDPKNPTAGIQDLRYIDPRKIRKVREVSKKKDLATEAKILQNSVEYYLFNDRGFQAQSIGPNGSTGASSGVRIAKDSIVQTTSGLASAKGDMILSYLHKAIKPLNMLRTMEDALVIYRVSRAPERRVFYIDVGNLPKMKAEQYLRDIMVKFKNKVVYDSTTGEIRDDRKFMTMLEDFWLPRREGGRGTEITTLPGGQNLGQMEDVLYFQQKLYKSLNVPVTRLDPQVMYSYGRVGEITREEVTFAKFIARLRGKFATLFTKILERQLVLKQVMSIEEFEEIAANITYNFAKDNFFEEQKESEILASRLNLLSMVTPFIGRYFSNKQVRKTILMQTDEDIQKIDEEIIEEMTDIIYNPPAPEETDGTPGGPEADPFGGPALATPPKIPQRQNGRDQKPGGSSGGPPAQ
jgi:hypothetical protein